MESKKIKGLFKIAGAFLLSVSLLNFPCNVLNIHAEEISSESSDTVQSQETENEEIYDEISEEESAFKYTAVDIEYKGKTTGLKAVASGRQKVQLTWNAVEGAKGYLIYGQKNGKYGYVGMTTSETVYIDIKALDTDYNFYWVFPYVTNDSGKMFPGSCEKYVYAKGICPAVTGLRASSVTGGVKLTWAAFSDAEGYLIYGMNGANNTYHYIGMTGNTSFTDTKASDSNWNFYWVFPYHKDSSGKMIVGGTAKYVYGKRITQTIRNVYWVSGGKSYHYSKDCTTLKRSKVILEGTLDEAFAQGKTDPCNLCVNGR